MAFNPDEHQYDEHGEHFEDECERCLEEGAVSCVVRCGQCCSHLLIETTLRDAEREPRIKALPTIKGFTDEVEGYLLNGPGGACVFLDEETRACTIYDTRPLICRLFDCRYDWQVVDPEDEAFDVFERSTW